LIQVTIFAPTTGKIETYTSTGVRAPWVTEQQIAPATANLEYRAKPSFFSGVLALMVWTTASTFVEPVLVAEPDIVIICYAKSKG